jgi:hypothetical protein
MKRVLATSALVVLGIILPLVGLGAASDSAVQKQINDMSSRIDSLNTTINSYGKRILSLENAAKPNPTAVLTIAPEIIESGGSAIATITGTNIKSCTGTGTWNGQVLVINKPVTLTPSSTSSYGVDCIGVNGTLVKTRSVELVVTMPIPPPPPPPINANNAVTITNKSGVEVANYPSQFGHPFVCGEIAHYPQVLINGSPALAQADVKNRCADGSVKFAVISTVLPVLPASGNVVLTFQDQPTGNNEPMTTEQMLATVDSDVRMELTQPATLTGAMDADTTQATWQDTLLAKLKTVPDGSLAFRVDGAAYQVTGINLSAQPSLGYALATIDAAVKAANLPIRTFGSIEGRVYAFGGKTLELATPTAGTDLGPLLFKNPASGLPQTVTSASLVEMLRAGKCKSWTKGAIAQSMLCVGDDLGFGDDGKPIGDRLYATFWPALGKVEVDVVSEITNSQNLRSRYYDVRILTGKAGATEAYAQKGIAHSAGTRWVRHVWLGGAPEQRVNRKRDMGYLVDTKFIPPYDPAVVVPETVIAERWAAWQTPGVHKQIGGEGWWNTGMPTPGERCEIGWTTCWTKRYLDTGDWRARDTATVQADLFGGFNAYYREGNAAKFMDKAKTQKGLGFPVVPYDRMSSWGDDLRVPGNVADRLNFTGPSDWSGFPDLFVRNGFQKDAAHRGAPDFALYLDTGKFYYLEEAQFWAAQGMFSAGPGNGYNGRGPGVRAYDQVRAQGWLTRDLANAWAISPDDDPFKAVLKDGATDFIACFEGERAITGSALQSHPMWVYCQGLKTAAPLYATLQDDVLAPLHWWDPVSAYDAANPAFYDTAVTAGATSHWMQNYVTLSIGQAVRAGLPADGIFRWTAANLIWQATSPDYNPWLQGEYVIPNLKWVTDANGVKKAVPFQSAKETSLAWAAGVRNDRSNAVVAYPGNTENYLSIAGAAAAMVAEVLNRPDVYAPFKTMLDPALYQWGNDARWRMVPRSIITNGSTVR